MIYFESKHAVNGAKDHVRKWKVSSICVHCVKGYRERTPRLDMNGQNVYSLHSISNHMKVGINNPQEREGGRFLVRSARQC